MASPQYKDRYLREVQVIIGYTFRRPNLLWEALQASDSTVTFIDPRPVRESNKRLALVGRAALKLMLANNWWYKANELRTGFDRTYDNNVSRAILNTIGQGHHLHNYMVGNPSRTGGVSLEAMADMVEAILGAAFMDRGLYYSRRVAMRLGLPGPL